MVVKFILDKFITALGNYEYIYTVAFHLRRGLGQSQLLWATVLLMLRVQLVPAGKPVLLLYSIIQMPCICQY
jgi:hypothetical protein